MIVAEYDGVFYVEKEITDRTFTGTPVDFPPLETACRPCRITLRMESKNYAVQAGIRKGPGDSI